MKICDLTQFYSPFSGGVKRYLHEKIAYIRNHSPEDEHVLVVPGSKTEVATDARSRVYSIRSPLVSRSSRYRALLNLRAMEEILERERPDLIEPSDPYQIGWKAIAAGRALNVPVVGIYHCHFPESYLRSGTKFLCARGPRTTRSCGLSATGRREAKYKGSNGASKTSLSYLTAQILSIWPVTIEPRIFLFIRASRNRLDLYRWTVRRAAHPS